MKSLAAEMYLPKDLFSKYSTNPAAAFAVQERSAPWSTIGEQNGRRSTDGLSLGAGAGAAAAPLAVAPTAVAEPLIREGTPVLCRSGDLAVAVCVILNAWYIREPTQT